MTGKHLNWNSEYIAKSGFDIYALKAQTGELTMEDAKWYFTRETEEDVCGIVFFLYVSEIRRIIGKSQQEAESVYRRNLSDQL